MPSTNNQSPLLKDCPAFEDGCCFADLMDPKMNECTPFYAGCPFKDASTQEEVNDILSNMLDTSTSSHGSQSKQMRALFSELHKTSADLKEKMGQCPVFNTGCPFKSPQFTDTVQHVLAVKSAVKDEQSKQKLADELDEPHPEFSKLLRESTMPGHDKANEHPFIQRFIKRDIVLEQYRQYVLNLYFLYSELEDAMDDMATLNQLLMRIHFPKTLPRAARLRNDLNFLYAGVNEDWEKTEKPCEAMQKYIARVKEVRESDADMLVSHHYIRYIGDLSGAQYLARVAREAFEWTDDAHATSFVEFPDLPQNKDKRRFKDEYREILNKMPLSAAMQKKIIDEVSHAYDLNIDFFTFLGDLAPATQPIASLKGDRFHKANSAAGHAHGVAAAAQTDAAPSKSTAKTLAKYAPVALGVAATAAFFVLRNRK